MLTGPFFPIYQIHKSFPFDNTTSLIPADGNCSHGIKWVWIVMGECVMDFRGGAALFFGLLSVLLCFVNLLPQIIENFRRGLPDKAVSPFFLLFWFIGDISNFIGCILTHQLILQIVTSVYGILIDITMLGQFIFYKHRHSSIEIVNEDCLSDGFHDSFTGQTISHQNDLVTLIDEDLSINNVTTITTTTNNNVQRLAIGLVTISSFSFTAVYYESTPKLWLQSTITIGTYDSSIHRIPSTISRHLLQWQDTNQSLITNDLYPDFLVGYVAKLGYALGWLSTSMYICGRFPQILTNFKRKSTEGLSIYMFIMLMISNTVYGLQIILFNTERNYLLRAVPWLIGNCGTLILDFTATLSKEEACKVWRARNRLKSSLLAIFPAALIGQLVTVTLLDETRVTGRLSCCDGFMNLELDDGVLIRIPSTNQTHNEPEELDKIDFVQTITIFGSRIRYVSFPEQLNLSHTLGLWESSANDYKKIVPRPIKDVKVSSSSLLTSPTVSSTQTNSSGTRSVQKEQLNHRSSQFKLSDRHLEAFELYGLQLTNDENLDKMMAQTIDYFLDE